MQITVEMGETQYRLIGGGQEGGTVPYGTPAALMVGQDVYYAVVVDENAEMADVMRVDSVSVVDDVQVEDVLFDGEGDEDDDQDDDEADPDDPDAEPDQDQDDDDDDDQDDGEIVDVKGEPVEDAK